MISVRLAQRQCCWMIFPWHFLGEVAFRRPFFAFLSFSVPENRGTPRRFAQLSLFELVMILTLVKAAVMCSLLRRT